ncbi:Sulfotransferase family protein [Candidatus Magnetomoraceae bacterium gMMP-1]
MDNNIISIISGLPRSGTSMMMKMLEAGGMKILIDNIRKADQDNPDGYYEFEKVKKIKEDSSWLQDAQGKVFKMVSMLLYELPLNRNYKIVFMKRNIDELLASQRRMLERQGANNGDVNNREMKKLYLNHLNQIEKWLNLQKNIDVLYVSYNDIIKSPFKHAKIINEFFGNILKVQQMANIVDVSLYRNRINVSRSKSFDLRLINIL